MNRALLTLLRLQLKGWVRRQFSGGSIRRTVFAVLGLVMFLLWLTSVALGAVYQQPRTPEEVMALLPFYLTGFALLPIVFGNEDRAIAFTPAEVDFLFPGPFGRRELILFKMLKLALSSVMGGLFFGLVLRRSAATLPSAMLGAALALVFINFMATIVALVRDTLEERFYRLARRGATVAVIGATAAIVWHIRESDGPPMERLNALAVTIPGRIILAPSTVFAHVFASTTLEEAARWAGACLGLIAAALVVVLALDRGYMEAAVAASQRRQAKLTRLRKGLTMPTDRPMRRLRVPGAGLFGASGAIVTRQLITAFRTSRAWLVIFVLALAYSYAVSRMTASDPNVPRLAGLVPGLFILLTMLPQMLRFDFRSELDHMDLLKSLPLTPFSITLAEMAVPVVILTLQVWVVEAGAAAFMPLDSRVLVMAALAIPLVAALVIGLENFVFLMMPTRLITPGQGGAAFSGRRLVMLLARVVLIAVGGSVVGGVAVGAWSASASVEVTYGAAWVALLLVAAGVVRAVAWAYTRFDVSIDMPV